MRTDSRFHDDLPLPPGSVYADVPAAGAAERPEEPPRHRGRPVQTGHQVSPPHHALRADSGLVPERVLDLSTCPGLSRGVP